MARGHFSWIELLPQLEGHHEYIPFVHSMMVTVGVLGAALVVRGIMSAREAESRRRLADGSAEIPEHLVPSEKLTLQNMFELFGEQMLGLFRPILHHHTNMYFPLIATMFLYITLSNLLGVIPGFQPPTSHLETNAAMALTVFAGYNIIGFRHNGFGYIKHFLGPVIWIAPFMLGLELISHIFRPISLTLRLYGNIMGDHAVLGVFMYTLPDMLFAPLAFGIPMIFLGLGMFVSVVQALVFSLLSASYIGMAAAEEH